MTNLEKLPGEKRVREGLRDISDGRISPAALGLFAASRRLRALGLPIPAYPQGLTHPELVLYEALRRQGGDAYTRYNALCHELDSFISALESRHQRANP